MKCDLCGRYVVDNRGTGDDILCYECYCKINDIVVPRYMKLLSLVKQIINNAKKAKINKNIAIAVFLSLVLIFSFVIQVSSVYLGPITTEEKDDIGIKEAYYNKNSNELIIITLDRWAKLRLTRISKTNKKYDWHIKPVSGNFLHWKSFKKGTPSKSLLNSSESVAIATSRFASFSYGGRQDGYPWHNFEHRAEIPQGYSYVLYRSDAEHAANNVNWYKGYILQTPFKNVDNRYGIKFYYHPDITYKLAMRHPLQFILFGGSYLALCIMTITAFGGTRKTAILFPISIILHLISSVFLFVNVRVGEAWSGYSTAHYLPQKYFVVGSLILIGLLIIKIVRSTSKA